MVLQLEKLVIWVSKRQLIKLFVEWFVIQAEAAYLYFSLIQNQETISRLSNGGAQDNLSQNFIDGIKLVVPHLSFIETLKLAAIIERMSLNTKEIALLEELQIMTLAQLSSH